MLKNCKYIICLVFLNISFSLATPLELRKETLTAFHQASWLLSEVTKVYLPHSHFNNYYQNCPLNLPKPISVEDIKELQKLLSEADKKIIALLSSVDTKKIEFSHPELDNDFKPSAQVLIEHEPSLLKFKNQICYPKFSSNSDNAVKAFLSPSIVPAFIYLENKYKDLGKEAQPFTTIEIAKYFGWYLEIRQHYNLLLEVLKLTKSFSLESLPRFEVNPQVAGFLNYTQQQYGSSVNAKKLRFYYFESCDKNDAASLRWCLVEPPHERRLTVDEIAYAKMALKRDYPELLTGVKDLAINFLFQEYLLSKQFIKEEDIEKESLLTIPNACLEKKDDYLINAHTTNVANGNLATKEESTKAPLIVAVTNLLADYADGAKKFPVELFTQHFFKKAYEQINIWSFRAKAGFNIRLETEVKKSSFNVDNLFQSLESFFPYVSYFSAHATENNKKLAPTDFIEILSDKLQKWIVLVPSEYFEAAKKGSTKELIESIEEPLRAALIDSLEAYVLSQVSENLKPYSKDELSQQFKEYLSYYWRVASRKKWEEVIDSVELKAMVSAIATEIVDTLAKDKVWMEKKLSFSESIRNQKALIQILGKEKIIEDQVQSLQAEKFLKDLESKQFKENFIPFKKETKYSLADLAANGIAEPNATLAQDFSGMQKLFLQKAQEDVGLFAKKIREYFAKTYHIEESLVEAYLKNRYPKLVTEVEQRPSYVLANAVIQGSFKEILNSQFDDNRFTHLEAQIKRYGHFMRFIESLPEKDFYYPRISMTHRIFNSILKDTLEKLYQNQKNPKEFSEWKNILALQLKSISKDEAILEIPEQDIWPEYLKYKNELEKIKTVDKEIEKQSSAVKAKFATLEKLELTDSKIQAVQWPLMFQYLKQNETIVKKLYQNRLQVIFESKLMEYYSKDIPKDKKAAVLLGIVEELYRTLNIDRFDKVNHVALREQLKQIIEQGEVDYKKMVQKTYRASALAYEFLVPLLRDKILTKEFNITQIWHDNNLQYVLKEKPANENEQVAQNAIVTNLGKLLSSGFAPTHSKKLIWLEDFYFEKVLSHQLLPSHSQVKKEFLDLINSRFESITLAEIEEIKSIKSKLAPLKEYLAVNKGKPLPPALLKSYENYSSRLGLLEDSLKKWQRVHLILVKYFSSYRDEVKAIIEGEKNLKEFENLKINEFIWDEFQNATAGINGEDLALTPKEIENDLKFIASQSTQKRELKKEQFVAYAKELSDYCKAGIQDPYYGVFKKNFWASLNALPTTIPIDIRKYLGLPANFDFKKTTFEDYERIPKVYCENIQKDIEKVQKQFNAEEAWSIIHLRQLFFNNESDFNPIITAEKVYYFSKSPTSDFNLTVQKDPNAVTKTLFEQIFINPESSNFWWVANTLKNFIEESNLKNSLVPSSFIEKYFPNSLISALEKPQVEKYQLINAFGGNYRGKLFQHFNKSLLVRLNSVRDLEALFPKGKVKSKNISEIHHQFRLAISIWKSTREYQRKSLAMGHNFNYNVFLNNLADYLYVQFYRYTPVKLKGSIKDFKKINVLSKALAIDNFILEYETHYSTSGELPKTYSNKDWVRPAVEEFNQEENERGVDFLIWNFVPDELRPETKTDYMDTAVAWDQYCFDELKKGNLCHSRPFVNYPVAWMLQGTGLNNAGSFNTYWQALIQSPVAKKLFIDLKLPKGKRHIWALPNVNTLEDFEKHPLKKQYEELLKVFDKNSKTKISPSTIGYFLIVLNSASKKSEPIDLYKKPEEDAEKLPNHKELLSLLPILLSKDILNVNKKDFDGWKNFFTTINPSDWQGYYVEKYLAAIGNGQSFYTTQVPACYESKPLKASPTIIAKVYNNKDKTEAYHNRFVKIQLEPQGYQVSQKPLEHVSEWQLAKNDVTYWQKISGNPGKFRLEELSQLIKMSEGDLIRVLQSREKWIQFKKILNEINAEGSVKKAELENLWLGYSGNKLELTSSKFDEMLLELDSKADAQIDSQLYKGLNDEEQKSLKEKTVQIDKYFKLQSQIHLHEETSKQVTRNIHNELKELCEMPNFTDVAEKKDFDKYPQAIKRLSQYNNIHKTLLLEENYSPALHYDLKEYLENFKENNQPIIHKISQKTMEWGVYALLGGLALRHWVLPEKAASWMTYKTSQSSFLQKNLGRAGVIMNILFAGALSADMVYRYKDKFMDEPEEFKKLNETRNTKSSVRPEKSAIPLMDAQMVSQIEQFRKKIEEDLYAWDTYAWMGLDAAITVPIITSVAYKMASPIWRYIRGGDKQLLRASSNYLRIDPSIKMTPQKIKETLLVESPRSIEQKAISEIAGALGATEYQGIYKIKDETAKYLQNDLALLRNQMKVKAEPTFQAQSSGFKKFIDTQKQVALNRISLLEKYERKLALRESFTRAEMEELMWILPQDFAPHTRQVPFVLKMLGVDMPITQTGRDVKKAYKISQAYLDLLKEFHPEYRFTMAVLTKGKRSVDDFVLNETQDLHELIKGPAELEKHFRDVLAKAKEFANQTPYDVIGDERLYEEMSRLRRFYQYMTDSANLRQEGWVLEKLGVFEGSKPLARHYRDEAKMLKEKYGELTFNTYAQDYLVRKNASLSIETQKKMMNFKQVCEWYDKEFSKVQQYARIKGYSVDEVLQQMLGFKTRVILDGAEGEFLMQLGKSLKEKLTQSGWKGNLDLLRAIANEDYQQIVKLLFVNRE